MEGGHCTSHDELEGSHSTMEPGTKRHREGIKQAPSRPTSGLSSCKKSAVFLDSAVPQLSTPGIMCLCLRDYLCQQKVQLDGPALGRKLIKQGLYLSHDPIPCTIGPARGPQLLLYSEWRGQERTNTYPLRHLPVKELPFSPVPTPSSRSLAHIESCFLVLTLHVP